MATTFWPTLDHWSVKIPLQSGHYRMPALDDTGFVALKPIDFTVPSVEWESLEYMDWKSGGDTNFAPIASADGELDCRGFWDKGKPDKGAMFTSNRGEGTDVGEIRAGHWRELRSCPHHQARTPRP